MRANPTTSVPPELRQARIATSALSVIPGVLVGGWVSRVPDIREQATVNDVQWGLANSLETAAGLLMLGTLLFVIGRANVRLLSMISTVGLLVVTALLGLVADPLMLIGLLIVYGVANQIGETPNVALGLEVQRRYGRPILGSYVACWSIGSFAGGAIGTGGAALAIPISYQFVLTSLVLGSGFAIVARWLPDAPRQSGARRERVVLRRLNPQLGLIAVLALLAAVVASTGELWAAIYVAEELVGGAVLGAVAVTSLSVARACGTLFVDRLIARFGLLRVFTTATAVATCGSLCVVLAPSAWWGIVGFIAIGLGSAAVSPMLFTSAAAQRDVTGGEGAVIVNLGEAPAWLLAPLAIGFLAELWGLHLAMLLLPGVLGLQLVIAPFIRAARAGQ